MTPSPSSNDRFQFDSVAAVNGCSWPTVAGRAAIVNALVAATRTSRELPFEFAANAMDRHGLTASSRFLSIAALASESK
jgi:hypothetical protein